MILVASEPLFIPEVSRVVLGFLTAPLQLLLALCVSPNGRQSPAQRALSKGPKEGNTLNYPTQQIFEAIQLSFLIKIARTGRKESSPRSVPLVPYLFDGSFHKRGRSADRREQGGAVLPQGRGASPRPARQGSEARAPEGKGPK